MVMEFFHPHFFPSKYDKMKMRMNGMRVPNGEVLLFRLDPQMSFDPLLFHI
jgi:hypothetical protein